MTKEEKRQKRLKKRAREERINNIIEKVFPWMFSIVFLVSGYFIFNIIKEHEQNKIEELRISKKYKIEVLDKYDCIGSTYHFIGGRVSEQEYHVIYKVIPLSDIADRYYYGDGVEDDNLPYKIYRKIKIGDSFIGNEDDIIYYYLKNNIRN